ncbi:hypothetical protein GGQ68_004348 [Sagittula marina]|uniref:Uncharacterized protein n=1 Tax=Sagittula marina TaxID=943940 RepID=A0A7W6GW24_9RHOB|nr:hypothetical protein [Sagittula marina]
MTAVFRQRQPDGQQKGLIAQNPSFVEKTAFGCRTTTTSGVFGDPGRSLRVVENQGVALANPHNSPFDFVDEIQGLTNRPAVSGAPNKIAGGAGTPPDNKESLSTPTAYAPSATGASLTEDRP